MSSKKAMEALTRYEAFPFADCDWDHAIRVKDLCAAYIIEYRDSITTLYDRLESHQASLLVDVTDLLGIACPIPAVLQSQFDEIMLRMSPSPYVRFFCMAHMKTQMACDVLHSTLPNLDTVYEPIMRIYDLGVTFRREAFFFHFPGFSVRAYTDRYFDELVEQEKSDSAEADESWIPSGTTERNRETRCGELRSHPRLAINQGVASRRT